MKGWKEEHWNFSAMRKASIATLNQEATFANKALTLLNPRVLLLFQFYSLSPWLNVAERTQRLGEKKYCVEYIKWNTKKGASLSENLFVGFSMDLIFGKTVQVSPPLCRRFRVQLYCIRVHQQ